MGWENIALGDFCEVIAGQSPEGKYYNDTGDGLPFYQGKKDFGSKFIGEPRTWTTHITKEAQAGDVLMSVRAPVGPINFATEKACIGRGLAAIRASEKVDRDFLFYGLLSKKNEVSGNEGAVFASINKKQIEAIEIPLPPLPEQKRIVAILDEAFAGIDAAVANTEKNLANARELFESYLNAVFTQKGDGWVEKKLGELCGFVRGPFGGSLKKSIFVPEGYAVYEQRNAIYDQFDEIRYFINETKFKEMSRFELFPNDLIMSCSGTMGRVAIVPEGIKRGIINQALLKLSPSEEVMSSFLKYWMDSEAFQDALKMHSGGAAIQNVASVKVLKEIEIPLPPTEIQEKVIEQIDAMLEQSSCLENIYQQKLDALAELKQSILQKAFAGELNTLPDKEIEEATA
ncbi:MAG: restriction endonuclease subunit S [Desulfuromonadales bacterium]|nr:restriction endonuclease subunit S [Desulfuromonadales bacterium]